MKNRENFKKGLFVTGRMFSKVTAIASAVSVLAFFAGLGANIALDSVERKEFKERSKARVNNITNNQKTK